MILSTIMTFKFYQSGKRRQFRFIVFNIKGILLLRDLPDKRLDDSIVFNILNLACEKSNKPSTNGISDSGDSTSYCQMVLEAIKCSNNDPHAFEFYL